MQSRRGLSRESNESTGHRNILRRGRRNRRAQTSSSPDRQNARSRAIVLEIIGERMHERVPYAAQRSMVTGGTFTSLINFFKSFFLGGPSGPGREGTKRLELLKK